MTGNNLYMPDAYGRGRSYESRTEHHRYIPCSESDIIWLLCVMHPAIFLPRHSEHGKSIITFVSQGAHWRTDAHNGKQCLWSV